MAHGYVLVTVIGHFNDLLHFLKMFPSLFWKTLILRCDTLICLRRSASYFVKMILYI